MLSSNGASARQRETVRYYPIFLNLDSRKTLVVGAGRVAERKVKALLQAGARVTVVAPRASAALKKLAAAGKIRWQQRRYVASDIKGAALVFCATDSAAIDRKVAAEASRRGIPVNCAGSPKFGSFLVPAQAVRGQLQIAVSTAGASPALARKLSRELKERIGPEYAEWTRLLARLRPQILESVPAGKRPGVFELLASDRIFRLLRKGEKRRAAEMARSLVAHHASKQKKLRQPMARKR
ncbi:MAG: bifunctional precorrin-2 dehydrogenase/sirohydrochlorin ferrochelatase [Acidobacteria bacterium]|nr:bifunctional precorrin-2 dehydrogenase/sirohydrochlorin ferrochelatase [Acidobacteriota bacterium]MCZ6752511.1 bifunctional precorrin-2 dehydrogenase/sirohydrochlorin ferrochelatase [Acidobacteriota bacterium]